ncbi:MAG: NAD-dependent epimerase/dehydratase family protein [Thermodesulfobacteriota bacterium]|nr:NAD-dependent epimerase/dehydratase family protein [Thermodesulfobacteriota bacterium]
MAETKPLILVTGANGFVGRHLCKALLDQGWSVRGAVRRTDGLIPGVEQVVVKIDSKTEWREILSGVSCVIHLAARVHDMKNSVEVDDYQRINTEATQQLARAAARAGVSRFIFASSVKAVAEASPAGKSLNEHSIPYPRDAYGKSKLAAEQILAEISRRTGMDGVSFRLPLIYGPEVRANFLRLIQLVDRGIPLPFRGINNKRSLLYVGNLTDAFCKAIIHPTPINSALMISDNDDLSSAELVELIAKGLERKAHLIQIPLPLLKLLGHFGDVIRKINGTFPLTSEALNRLTDSLTVNTSRCQKILEWTPPCSAETGIQKTVNWYRGNRTD